MHIDAYAHIGYPRFGTPEELIAIWKQWDIEKGCIALPPNMPDFRGLERACELLGDGIRLFGIPFGPDRVLRLELAEAQVDFGISGMRLAPDEILDNPAVLELLGEARLCLMAIGVHENPAVTRTILDWLERYPGGTVASPHFLKASAIEQGAGDPGLFRDLLRHPRMHAIFSRQGMTSREPYPHRDLKPWVEEVVELLSWDRVMWGSELPVIYHRDEQVDSVREWLRDIGIGMTDTEEKKYLGDNAERLFWQDPAPLRRRVTFPAWAEQGLKDFIQSNDPVPVLRTKDLMLPLDLHGRLMSVYFERQAASPRLEFREFIAGLLKESGSS